MTPTDQQTVAELARHNQELSLALSAAERRAVAAEKELGAFKAVLADAPDVQAAEIERLQAALDHAIELMNDQTTGSFYVLAEVDNLKAENKILQRTAELQLALVSATADVVEAARLAAAEFRGEPPDELWLAVRLTRLSKTLAALDQASPPLASGRPRTGYSGTYEDLGDVELPPEEQVEAERQIDQASHGRPGE